MATYQQQILPVQMQDGAADARTYLAEAREYTSPHDVASVAIKALRLLNRMAKCAVAADACDDREIASSCKRSWVEIDATIKSLMMLDGAMDSIAIVAKIEATDAVVVS